jgi:hypothetical protein
MVCEAQAIWLGRSAGAGAEPHGSAAMSAARRDPSQATAAPRAAAIAGVIFSGLLMVGLALIRLSVPAEPGQPGTWVADPARRNAVRLALNLFPFAGIAFLWFMGVLRNRLGAREDQFLATVFLSSGLLFVVSLFCAAAIAAGLLEAVADGHLVLPDSETYYFGHRTVYTLLNVFAFKMAAVFMFSTGTIGLRTAFLPRWVALVGYACALVLLLVITSWAWIGLLFPLWVLLVSIVVLTMEFRRRGDDTMWNPVAPAVSQEDKKRNHPDTQEKKTMRHVVHDAELQTHNRAGQALDSPVDSPPCGSTDQPVKLLQG